MNDSEDNIKHFSVPAGTAKSSVDKAEGKLSANFSRILNQIWSEFGGVANFKKNNLMPHNCPIIRTGSRVVGGCTPESDYDIVLYVKDIQEARELSVSLGYTDCKGRMYGDTPLTYICRKSEVNLIITSDGSEFLGWCLATELLENLPETLSKDSRAEVFTVIKSLARKKEKILW